MMRCVMIGSDRLLNECATQWRDHGHEVIAIVSDQPAIAQWAGLAGIAVLDQAAALSDAGLPPFDYLFNLDSPPALPAPVLAMPRCAAIHVHDGLLPGYAGRHAPVWALLNGEKRHGISWHLIGPQPGADDLLLTHSFDIDEDDSAVSVQAKCLIAARGSFAALITGLATGAIAPRPQDKSANHSHGLDPRPADAGMIDWHTDAHRIAHMVRALDHGAYANPLVIPKFSMNGHVLLVGTASVQHGRSTLPAGTIVSMQAGSMVVATATRDLQIGRITGCDGLAISLTGSFARDGFVPGAVLDRLSAEQRHDLSALSHIMGRHEPWWRHRLARLRPLKLPMVDRKSAYGTQQPAWLDQSGLCPEGARSSADRTVMAALVGYLARIAEQSGRDQTRFDLAYADPVLIAPIKGYEPWFATRLPLHIDLHFNHGLSLLRETLGADIREVRRQAGHAADLFARMPALRRKAGDDLCCILPVAIVIVDDLEDARADPGAELTIALRSDSRACRWFHDPRRLSRETVTAMQVGFLTFLIAAKAAPDRPIGSLPMTFPKNTTGSVEKGLALTRHDPCEHRLGNGLPQSMPLTLTYVEMDKRIQRLARHLLDLGITSDGLVGLHMGRCLNMVIALAAIHKAGGACVPLSPSEPAEEVARIIADCRPAIIVTDRAGLLTLPGSDTIVLYLDDDWPPPAQQPDMPPPDKIQPAIARTHHLVGHRNLAKSGNWPAVVQALCAALSGLARLQIPSWIGRWAEACVPTMQDHLPLHPRITAQEQGF